MGEHLYKVAVVTPRPQLRLSKQTYGYHIHCYWGDAVIWDKSYVDRDKAFLVYEMLEELIHTLCVGLHPRKGKKYPSMGLFNITLMGKYDMKKIGKFNLMKED